MIKPIQLPWPQINRILHILDCRLCHSLPGDKELAEATGLIVIDPDDDEYVSASDGADQEFFDFLPHPRVKDCWRADKEPLPTEKEAIAPERYTPDGDFIP